ncbi:hypothetical protein [Bradyrhizobium manausense]|nr:hypothetical protein [Bradyrhizobium manausense]
MAVFDPTHGKPALPHAGTFTANPVTMRAGLAAMPALTPESFAHLDHRGSLLREGITGALDLHGLARQCVRLGSLFKLDFTALPAIDYHSVDPGPPERRKLDSFHKGLLDRRVLSMSYGLFALSTAMTEATRARLSAPLTRRWLKSQEILTCRSLRRLTEDDLRSQWVINDSFSSCRGDRSGCARNVFSIQPRRAWIPCHGS